MANAGQTVLSTCLYQGRRQVMRRNLKPSAAQLRCGGNLLLSFGRALEPAVARGRAVYHNRKLYTLEESERDLATPGGYRRRGQKDAG
jgi:hypothetical protein